MRIRTKKAVCLAITIGVASCGVVRSGVWRNGYQCIAGTCVGVGCSSDIMNCSGNCTYITYTSPAAECYSTYQFLDQCDNCTVVYNPPIQGAVFNGLCDVEEINKQLTCVCHGYGIPFIFSVSTGCSDPQG